ncbi:MAG TPA: FAA hydrolase family protein [Bacteroidetes bacterium]|nr:FAA hydrolase family protein [Bacteroidota bacterium]
MIELGFFELDTFREVIETVSGFRSLGDLELRGTERVDLPVSRPQKVLCLGRNYKAHAEEWGATVPEEPIIFGKLVSSLTSHGSPIRIPSWPGSVEHEIELAVIIGKSGRVHSDREAWDFVAGYTIANDVTARDLQLADFKKGWPWLRSKSFDTFGPLGPVVVPRQVFPEPPELDMTLRVNGEVRQQANTREMVFGIPRILQEISRFASLTPGDVILTGTPAGTGPLRPGDVVEAEIEGIGVLSNTVVAE